MTEVLNRAKRDVLLISVLLLVVTLSAGVGTVGAQSAPDCSTVSYNGEGTESNPYEVGNVDQLQCIKEQGLDASYKVVSNINASGTSEWNDGKGFNPIGEFSFNFNRDLRFNGTFDGQGYNITNLTIDRSNEMYTGLFGFVESAGTVTNVGIIDVYVNGSRRVGGLVGRSNKGAITESYVTGSVEGNISVGGLIGEKEGSTINQSYVAGAVNGDIIVGGLVGLNDGGKIIESYSTGTVTGTRQVGGLVGENRRGTISEAYATGTLGGSASLDVGGLVGLNDGGKIIESYAIGRIKESDQRVGGLVGANIANGGITESYATGSVDGSALSGGLTGHNTGTISESYANGSVDGFRALGGFVGANEGTVRESYATGSVDGSRHAGGLVGDNSGGDINQSYATGAVSISDVEERVPRNEGGLVGRNEFRDAEGTITDSYWDTRTTGQSTSAGGGTGLNTSQMTGSAARGNMTGFDFTSAWETVSNPDGYPIPTREGDGIVINSGDESEMNNDDEDGSDGSADEENAPTGDDTGGEGLPGFTVVTAVLAVLTVVVAAVRRRTE
jgi:hypothetical protein